MAINDAQYRAAATAFLALYKGQFANAPSVYEQIAAATKSTGKQTTYIWAEALGLMKEWVGDRTTKKLSVHDFTIKNKAFEKSISVDYADIEDDNLGVYAALIQTLALAYKRTCDYLVFQLLTNGFTTVKSYDDKAFFATTHASGSNKGTAALAADKYEDAVEAMMAQTDDEGGTLDVFPTHLLVGIANRSTARTILKAERLTSGADNLNFNEVGLIVSARVSGANWFLIDASKPIKPLIVQARSLTEPRWITKPGEETTHGKWGFDGRFNAGVSLHQLAYGSTGAG